VSLDASEEAILRYLQGSRQKAPDACPRASAPSPGDAQVEQYKGRQKALRQFGLNLHEREALGRGTPSRPKPVDKDQARKRLEFYLDQRVANWPATRDRDQVVAAWAAATNYDVDMAKAWWDSGVHPLEIPEILDLIENGMELSDLSIELDGMTVLEHITHRSPARWLALALEAKKRRLPNRR
jgi:hypothetical protein